MFEIVVAECHLVDRLEMPRFCIEEDDIDGERRELPRLDSREVPGDLHKRARECAAFTSFLCKKLASIPGILIEELLRCEEAGKLMDNA